MHKANNIILLLFCSGAGGIARKEIEKFNIPRPPVEKSRWKIKIRHLKRWFQKNPFEQEKSQIIPSQGEDKDKSTEEKIAKSPREKGKQRKLFKYLRLRRKASSSEEVTIPPAVEKNDKKWHKFLNFFKRINQKDHKFRTKMEWFQKAHLITPQMELRHITPLWKQLQTSPPQKMVTVIEERLPLIYLENQPDL